MLEDQKKYLTTVCNFLNLKFSPKMMEKKRRKKSSGKSSEMPDSVRDRAIELYGGVGNNVEKLLGRIPESWKRAS